MRIVRYYDVREVRGEMLGKVDFFCGGSPCQGFSFSGKQLAFDDPRSVLFFEYVRLLNELREINPDMVWMLENVMMKKEFEQIITETVGVNPIRVNSALFSPQNRIRNYWLSWKVNPLLFVDRDATSIIFCNPTPKRRSEPTPQGIKVRVPITVGKWVMQTISTDTIF